MSRAVDITYAGNTPQQAPTKHQQSTNKQQQPTNNQHKQQQQD